MSELLKIEKFNKTIEDIIDEIPEVFFEGLNLGIMINEDVKEHPQSIDKSLYILGEYNRSNLGSQIIIYFGSFKHMYKYKSDNFIYLQLKEVLLHELTHHLEYRAGEIALETQDKVELENYLKSFK